MRWSFDIFFYSLMQRCENGFKDSQFLFVISHVPKEIFLLTQGLKLLGDLSMEIQELAIVFGDGVAFRRQSSEAE